jgi:hypothetical protein
LLDMKTLARRGAAVRLRELDDERRMILASFPDLRSSGSSTGPGRKRRSLAADRAPIEAPAAAPRRRKRRKMTAAEKKAASERMRRYWAAKK